MLSRCWVLGFRCWVFGTISLNPTPNTQDPLRDHLDGQEDRYVGTSFRMQMVLEQPPYDRKVTQQRNLGHLLDLFISDKAADHNRVAVLNADNRLGFARACLR